MQLVLTEDQELLAKTAADFVAEKSPVARVRELRDDEDPVGFSKKLWKEMAELGWVGIPFPEEHGGAGMGLAELVRDPRGRSAAASRRSLSFPACCSAPARSCSAAALRRSRRAGCRAVAEGEAILTLAHQEAGWTLRPAPRGDPQARTREGDGFTLRGEKVQVLDGHVADALIVPCAHRGRCGRRGGHHALPGAGGCGRPRSHAPAPGGRARRCPGEARRSGRSGRCGARRRGAGRRAAHDRGRRGHRGSLRRDAGQHAVECFDRTITYLKDREQFEVPIGSFQALKHRAAEVFVEVELARSSVMAAARAVDEGADDAARLVSLAKALCSDAAILVANEGVQMHGGVGMTDEPRHRLLLEARPCRGPDLRRRRSPPRSLGAHRRVLMAEGALDPTERLLRACRGEPDGSRAGLAHAPGRALPAPSTAQSGKARPFLDLCRDVEKSVEVSLQPLRAGRHRGGDPVLRHLRAGAGDGHRARFRAGSRDRAADPQRSAGRGAARSRAAGDRALSCSRSCAHCAPSSRMPASRCSASRARPSPWPPIWSRGRGSREFGPAASA